MYPIGIDLGTTYSSVAKIRKLRNGMPESRPYVIPQENDNTLPSKFYVEGDQCSNYILGRPAVRHGILNPNNYASAVKRLMDTNEPIKLDCGEFTPVKISSEIIKFLLIQVENVEGPGTFVPEGLVVTVPYYFGHVQNLNTKNAALSALEELYKERINNGKEIEELFIDLVPEPIAAGLDYAFNIADENIHDQNFLIFDLGGGTFDLTIFNLKQGRRPENGKEISYIHFEVLSIDGNDRLGGEDFDESLMTYILEETGILNEYNNLDEKSKRKAESTIRPDITNLKITLTTQEETELLIPNAIGASHIEYRIRRNEFEECLKGNKGKKIDYLEKIETKIDSVLDKAGMRSSDIDSVLLTGGSCMIPLVQNIVKRKFSDKKVRNLADLNLAVTNGATIYAAFKIDQKKINAAKNGNKDIDKSKLYLNIWDEIVITERNSHSLGIVDDDNQYFLIVSENRIMPYSSVNIFNPDTYTENNTKAKIGKIKVVQGSANSYTQIGELDVGDIYTHGRRLDHIYIKVNFIVQTTIVRVKIVVEKGKQDQSDLVVEEEISF